MSETLAFFGIPEDAGEPIPANPTDTLIQNLAHTAEAISHLIEFFRNGPRNQAILAAVGAQLQELENFWWDLLSAFDLSSAVGVQLDMLGKIVGELRAGRLDDDYRVALRVRILVNSSDGQPEQLYTIIKTMFPESSTSLTEYEPPGMIIELYAEFGAVTLQTIASLLRESKAGGVRLDLVAVDTGDALIMADSDFADVALGVGRDDDGTVGGTIAQVA